jgi:2-keto-4-pentenoate hydratase/2-oxohepta-3-ene-1,7-dioic acid hydratase in catechol pathway
VKLISYKLRDRASYGIVTDQGVIDAARHLGERYPTLRAALAGDALSELKKLAGSGEVNHKLADVTLLPVIPDPEKILCVGINYAAHVKETGREMPTKVMIFTRFANTQVGHNQPMLKPKVSDRYDFEGELAVVIGKRGRYIEEKDALSYVAGYSCYNDGSIRDWQRHTTQFTPGKNFPGTGAFGPWLVTADEIPDPSKLTLTTRLNGQVMQQSGTDDLIFSVPHCIAYCSSFTYLEPGDVIITGTPGGVGNYREPPIYMKAGDKIEVDITRIGTLVNPIADEKV